MPTTAEWRDAIRRRWPLLWRLAIVIALITGVAALWQAYNLQAYTNPLQILALGETLRSQPLAIPLILLLYIGSGIAFLPLTVMVVATIIIYGPVAGFLIANSGTLLTATVGFILGHILGARPLQRLSGALIQRLDARAAAHGVVLIAALRILPIAHFHAVSLIAGASRIRFRQYLGGTMLGTVPGIAVIAALGNQAKRLVVDPNMADILLFTGIGVVSLLGFSLLRRYLKRFTGDIDPNTDNQ